MEFFIIEVTIDKEGLASCNQVASNPVNGEPCVGSQAEEHTHDGEHVLHHFGGACGLAIVVSSCRLRSVHELGHQHLGNESKHRENHQTVEILEHGYVEEEEVEVLPARNRGDGGLVGRQLSHGIHKGVHSGSGRCSVGEV